MLNKKIKTIKICPECHNADLKHDWALRGTIYECLKCGYRGVFILEMPLEKLKRFREREG